MNQNNNRALKGFLPVLMILLLGVGAYVYSGSGFGTLKVSVPVISKKMYCDKELLAENGVDADKLSALQQALSRHAKHVCKADMFVDKATKKGGVFAKKQESANFHLTLELSNGCKLTSRPADVAWNKLDNAMASAVDRCMGEYFKLSGQSKMDMQGKVIMNL